MRSQGAEESDLSVMLAKFIAQIDLIDSKQLNVTEQSVMLSCYASREALLSFAFVLKDRPVNPAHNALLCS